MALRMSDRSDENNNCFNQFNGITTEEDSSFDTFNDETFGPLSRSFDSSLSIRFANESTEPMLRMNGQKIQNIKGFEDNTKIIVRSLSVSSNEWINSESSESRPPLRPIIKSEKQNENQNNRFNDRSDERHTERHDYRQNDRQKERHEINTDRYDYRPNERHEIHERHNETRNDRNTDRFSRQLFGSRRDDWYQTYGRQTHRFPQSNERSNHSEERRVHFQDVNDRERGVDEYTNGSYYSDNQSVNGYETHNDFRRNGRECDNIRESEETNVYSFPKLESKGSSIVESLLNGVIKPAANNIQQDLEYGQNQWNRNMSQIYSTLNKSTLFSDSIWSNTSNPNNAFIRFFNSEEKKSKIDTVLAASKRDIAKIAPNYTWSGQLPRKLRTKNQVFSPKVFLGGIPYDLTDSDLHCTFAQFGHIQIQWPGKDIRSAIDGAAANKAGYVYIIFETYENVTALLAACTISYRDIDSGCRFYYNISSRRQKAKEVQVIPFDIGDRFFMKQTFTGQMDNDRTVFVGGLHGMLSADGLAKVMDDLFGGVIFAGLDTDKSKYPLGSGRVIFDNQESYLKAVTAAFVEIKSHRFKKRIQIDPYIENEKICAICKIQQNSPVFCREEFIYFCPECWTSHHSDPESENHRPIIKNKSSKA